MLEYVDRGALSGMGGPSPHFCIFLNATMVLQSMHQFNVLFCLPTRLPPGAGKTRMAIASLIALQLANPGV